ncbi:ribose-5-phosphate isomerase RpiA [Cohnella sp.]|uniref:ribose-5-phosphate isomerase RpiA n=1 Tax=Cohnella sp. TaxID=1883426 RepID=UPI00356677F1
MKAKQAAADKAVEFIKDGMVVGLGSGSTSYWAIRKLADRVQEGLEIRAVASSKSSEELAIQWGIPIVTFAEISVIDITIDGADEVDPDFNLIKGGGGALLREKILAASSHKFIVIIDESKLVNTLGEYPLPVEIVPFAAELTLKKLEALQCKPVIRKKDEKVFFTDNGNLIIDCKFKEIANPKEQSEILSSIPGVVDHGLFIQMTDTVIVGNDDGTTRFLNKRN